MKYYYYHFESYDHKRKRWIKKRDYYLSYNEMFIGHVYGGTNYGLIKPTKLQVVFDENDNLIYGSL